MKRTPQKIETLRKMAARKALTPEIAKALDVSPACVWQWAKTAGIKLVSPREAMKQVTSNPEWRAKISASMRKLHTDPVYRAEHMMRMARLQADEVHREKMRQARLRRNAERQAAKMVASVRSIVVPHWVPDELVAEYREHVQLTDEFAAAKHLRALKAEMRAS